MCIFGCTDKIKVIRVIKQAKFVISVADGNKVPDYGMPEIAISGKSNVGKSSFINFLTNQNKLARTSGDPGRTRLLNFFEINNGEYHFVDLPGYGYAKVSKEEKAKWGGMIENYLVKSKNLRNVFVLVDSRHEPSSDDKMMINFLFYHSIPFTIIATKADKMSRMQQQKARKVIADSLKIGVSNVIMTSATNKIGKEDVLARIDQILEIDVDLD